MVKVMTLPPSPFLGVRRYGEGRQYFDTLPEAVNQDYHRPDVMASR
jgi:hypothetical protein